MPPKKVVKKLHELSAEVKVGFKITDVKKKTFIVGKQFATGGFGRIHTCTEEGKSQQLVVKIEPSDNGPLFTEVNVFQRILRQEQIEEFKKKRNIAWIGLPFVISNGVFSYEGDKMRYMIIPKYATSLENVRESNDGKFSAKETAQVALCTLNSLEYVHEMDYTHADIKAANILLEKVDHFDKAVLVDFGLARLSSKNEDKPDKKRAHNGTCIFTSIDAHRGCHPSFRGDIEILAYNVIYWLTGTLPWASLESSPDKVYEAKTKFISGLPGTLKTELKNHTAAIESVTEMFDIAKKTKYSSKVDYTKLKSMLSKLVSSSSKEKLSSVKCSEPEEVTPRKSIRRTKRVEVEKEDEEEYKEDDVSRKRVRQTPRKVAPPTGSMIAKRSRLKTAAAARKGVSKAATAENSSPKTKSPLKSSPPKVGRTNISIAKKIEKKYKRLSMNRSVLQPVSVLSSPDEGNNETDSRKSGGSDFVDLKTPAAAVSRSMRTRSGISSATKASPSKLRSVPGMSNFPKGRRTILIKQTADLYSKRRAAKQTGGVESTSSP